MCKYTYFILTIKIVYLAQAMPCKPCPVTWNVSFWNEFKGKVWIIRQILLTKLQKDSATTTIGSNTTGSLVLGGHVIFGGTFWKLRHLKELKNWGVFEKRDTSNFPAFTKHLYKCLGIIVIYIIVLSTIIGDTM